MDAKSGYNLDERAREILQWAISTFIATGKPVGSRTIARKSHEHLSAATVRNIMADLEEMGYLGHPHASAGRVPTDKAYRLYVDSMLEKREISQKERRLINQSLRSEDNPELLMARTCQVLSSVSQNLGIVVSPPISQVSLQHIQFIKLSENRLLVVLVSRSGLVQNRIIHPVEDYNQTELDQAARYIIEHFKERTLAEIKNLLSGMIGEERALYDQLVRRVILLSNQAFSEVKEGRDAGIYLDGASNLMRNLEFSDITRMRVLFQTIEERNRLAALISECIRGDTQEVRITIGAENALPGIEDCTLIASRYVIDDKTAGSLGILGPTRMEYARAISLVEYVARIFGQVLGSEGSKT